MPAPRIEIEYCPGCRWMLRAAWFAQELLTTFETEIGEIALMPSAVSGTFIVRADGDVVWDRRAENGFPELKELKQRLRDLIAPGRDLGHSDAPHPGEAPLTPEGGEAKAAPDGDASKGNDRGADARNADARSADARSADAKVVEAKTKAAGAAPPQTPSS